MGNQNQNNQNNNSRNINFQENNNTPPPSSARNVIDPKENPNRINIIKNDSNINSKVNSSDENQNRIIEESNNVEENKNNENSENSENSNCPPPNSENNNNSDCPVPADLSSYEKHFSFNGLMTKIKDTAKKAGLKAIYMALLLYYALESPTISTLDKAIIYGALGYFISPIDIVPDILPLIGLSDDIAVLAWAFSRVKHNVTDMTREKAKTKLKIWFGNFDEKEIDDL